MDYTLSMGWAVRGLDSVCGLVVCPWLEKGLCLHPMAGRACADPAVPCRDSICEDVALRAGWAPRCGLHKLLSASKCVLADAVTVLRPGPQARSHLCERTHLLRGLRCQC